MLSINTRGIITSKDENAGKVTVDVVVMNNHFFNGEYAILEAECVAVIAEVLKMGFDYCKGEFKNEQGIKQWGGELLDKALKRLNFPKTEPEIPQQKGWWNR